MISILLTIKDRQGYLDRQVDVLLRQLPALKLLWEIVVYDDGSSTPLTMPVSDHRVKLVRGERNVGLIEARNILANLVCDQAKYLFFLDDDIFVHNLERYIERAIQEISEGYSCVSAPFINLPTYKYERISTFKHVYDVTKNDDEAVYFFGGTSIFDRSAFVQAGGLEGNYYIYLEEEDLALRMYSLGMKIKIIYGDSFIAVHDQAPGKDFSERQVYLLSNRFLFHYKFIGNPLVRLAFNISYVAMYLMKSRSISLITRSCSRYASVRDKIFQNDISFGIMTKFLLKRYFNV